MSAMQRYAYMLGEPAAVDEIMDTPAGCRLIRTTTNVANCTDLVYSTFPSPMKDANAILVRMCGPGPSQSAVVQIREITALMTIPVLGLCPKLKLYGRFPPGGFPLWPTQYRCNCGLTPCTLCPMCFCGDSVNCKLGKLINVSHPISDFAPDNQYIVAGQQQRLTDVMHIGYNFDMDNVIGVPGDIEIISTLPNNLPIVEDVSLASAVLVRTCNKPMTAIIQRIRFGRNLVVYGLGHRPAVFNCSCGLDECMHRPECHCTHMPCVMSEETEITHSH